MTCVVALLFPGVTQLDLTGPLQVFETAGFELHLASATAEPVTLAGGWSITGTDTYDSAPQADVLLVPGGDGAFDLLDDPPTLEFLRAQGASARWVTSVCTGAFLLQAAGLLRGFQATTHWASLWLLGELRVTLAPGRVAFDGNRITCTGVSAGIDLAFAVVARERGTAAASEVALRLEYAPEPVFPGSPEESDQTLAANIEAATIAARATQIRRLRQ